MICKGLIILLVAHIYLHSLCVCGQQYCIDCDVKKNDYLSGAALEPALADYYTCATNISLQGSEVHVLSVYEGEAPHHDPSDIKLFIRISSGYQQQHKTLKVKLVLTSYEPINWQISLQEGIVVDNITLVSYYLFSSNVRIDGVRREPNFKIKDYFGTGDEIPDNEELFALVRKNYGFITSLTGTYRARQFSLTVGSGQSCTGTVPEVESCHICKVKMNGPSSASHLPGGNFFDDNTYSCSTNVVQGYDVHVIAIENANQSPWHETGQVKVFVNQPQDIRDRSLKLILVANSAIEWMVYTEDGIVIEEIILTTGMSPSEIVEDCTVTLMSEMEAEPQVTKIRTNFGYGRDIGKTQDLFDIIYRKFGFITSFTGTRSAKEFHLTTGQLCPAPLEGLSTSKKTITTTRATSPTITTTNSLNYDGTPEWESGSSDGHVNLKMVVILGAVIGAVVLLIACAAVVIFLIICNRNKRHTTMGVPVLQPSAMHPTPFYPCYPNNTDDDKQPTLVQQPPEMFPAANPPANPTYHTIDTEDYY